MKTTLLLIVSVALAGVGPAMADVKDQPKTSGEAKSPHQELREALDKIRWHYGPDDRALVGYRLAGAGQRARLGILLGGAWWSQEQIVPGAVIVGVTPGSPADEAGLMAGDVITKFNGENLVDEHGREELESMAASRKLVELSDNLEDGDVVTLEYVRDGSTHSIDLVAREHEFDPITIDRLREMTIGEGGRPFAWASAVPARWFVPRAWLDMELVALNPELGEYFGADNGVLVVRGPQEDDALGLKSGDVILRIGGREVRNPEHAMRILRSYEPDEELTLDIIRHGRSETLTGRVPESPVDFEFDFDFEKIDP